MREFVLAARAAAGKRALRTVAGATSTPADLGVNLELLPRVTGSRVSIWTHPKRTSSSAESSRSMRTRVRLTNIVVAIIAGLLTGCSATSPAATATATPLPIPIADADSRADRLL